MRSDEEYRALQEQAHLLSELERHPGWDVLVGLVDASSRPAKKTVLNGHVATIEQYKMLTGELIGIQKVIDLPAAVRGMLATEQEQRVDRDEPLT